MKRLLLLAALFGTVIITGASNPGPALAGFSDGGDRATVNCPHPISWTGAPCLADRR
jgi:hypothetical protein